VTFSSGSKVAAGSGDEPPAHPARAMAAPVAMATAASARFLLNILVLS
jgi:hypothetical protein